jgi:hypothetical protein
MQGRQAARKREELAEQQELAEQRRLASLERDAVDLVGHVARIAANNVPKACGLMDEAFDENVLSIQGDQRLIGYTESLGDSVAALYQTLVMQQQARRQQRRLHAIGE